MLKGAGYAELPINVINIHTFLKNNIPKYNIYKTGWLQTEILIWALGSMEKSHIYRQVLVRLVETMGYRLFMIPICIIWLAFPKEPFTYL